MATRVLLAGYLGSGNLGDDAILLGFVNGLAETGIHVSVLSGHPEETNRYYGLPAIQRRDFPAIEKAIADCDALVFPGGSIFQDKTSVRSVYYYSKLVQLAKKARKKVVLVGQGVGPLNTFFGKRLAAKAFGLADAIAVRDPASVNTLRELGVRKPIKVAADLAFLLPPPVSQSGQAEEGFGVGNMKTVAIAPRPLKGHDVAGIIADFCRLLYQSGTLPVLLPMDRNEDLPLILEISKRQGGKIPDMKGLETPVDVQRRLGRMEAVVAMRLHGGILSATVDVPPLMVSYDPKVAAFARTLDIGSAVGLEHLTGARLFESFTGFFRDRDRNSRLLERKRQELFNLAQQNIELVRDTVRPSATM